MSVSNSVQFKVLHWRETWISSMFWCLFAHLNAATVQTVILVRFIRINSSFLFTVSDVDQKSE